MELPDEVRVLPDQAALVDAALRDVLTAARAAIEARGSFSMALAGGRTPRALYLALARASAPFERWSVFFGDERCVPPDHTDSNFRMVREAWLDRAARGPAQVHRMAGELEPEAAAAAYERDLTSALGDVPRIDLVLLGLGEDGHTASLFPGSVALEEDRRLVVAAEGGAPVSRRITLTLPALSLARELVFLVAGSPKAEVVRKALRPRPDEPLLPVHAVLGRCTRASWLLDEAAASEL